MWEFLSSLVSPVTDWLKGRAADKPREAVLFEAGGVAALLRIAQRLDLLGVINQAAPKREQGPSVGQYLTLAALNRALAPCSKMAIGDWYEKSVLRRLWRFEKKAFSSQRFWDHMSMVSQTSTEPPASRIGQPFAIVTAASRSLASTNP